MKKYQDKGIDRRGFLKSGSILAFSVSSGLFFQFCNTPKLPVTTPINSWVQIKNDGTVIIYNPAAEMGQGSMTALPIILAEEMDADWSLVQIADSPIDAEIYGHDGWGMRPMMAIVGSYAVEGYYEKLRLAGAQVRKTLIDLAAAEWEVSSKEITTSSGIVLHQKTGRRLSYGTIAGFGKIPNELPKISLQDLKDPKDFKLIGKSIPRRDLLAKINGSAIYSIDVFLPDMVYGVMQHTPVKGYTPVLLNETEISNRPNIIKVVHFDNAIGLIAKTVESAFEAKKLLEIKWEVQETNDEYNSQQTLDFYAKQINQDQFETKLIYEQGDTNQSLEKGTVYTSNYYNDYVYHAQLEPLNAVVSFSADASVAEVWIGTQAPDSALREVARTLNIKESNITLHRCYLGGGFGRRTKRDFLIDACLLAKETKFPLKLIWAREDDLQNGMLRPATLQQIRASVSKEGEIVSWDYKTIDPGKVLIHTGAKIPFYDIPNQKIVAKYISHNVKTCSWRGEGHGPNKYAIESFIDEISITQKIDPIELRRNLLKKQPRALAVVNKVAEMANWEQSYVKERGRGFSFCERNSLTACICEISLNSSTYQIKVHKVWMAIDAGIVVQPKNAEAQVEGGILMAISTGLKEQITVEDGAIKQSNFDNYSILRCSDTPEEIHIAFMPSKEKPTGIGEAALPSVVPAIANAFADLTGKRLYHMPFTPERIKKTLES